MYVQCAQIQRKAIHYSKGTNKDVNNVIIKREEKEEDKMLSEKAKQ